MDIGCLKGVQLLKLHGSRLQAEVVEGETHALIIVPIRAPAPAVAVLSKAKRPTHKVTS